MNDFIKSLKDNTFKIQTPFDVLGNEEALRDLTNMAFAPVGNHWRMSVSFALTNIEQDRNQVGRVADYYRDYASEFRDRAIDKIVQTDFGLDHTGKFVCEAGSFPAAVRLAAFSLMMGDTPLSKLYHLDGSVVTEEKILGDHVCIFNMIVHAKPRSSGELVFAFVIVLKKGVPDYETGLMKILTEPTKVFVIDGINEETTLAELKKEMQIVEGSGTEEQKPVLQETCKHCGKPIKWDTTKKQWVEIMEGTTGIEQYCWIDMVQGSQLHHP